MSDLKCPACGEEFLEDSKFCDMCGTELLQCVNCGTLGTPDDMFCPECGKPMVSRKTSSGSKPIKTGGQTPATDDVDDPHGTGRGVRRSKKMVLRYKGDGNIQIVAQDKALIGRENSPYMSQISSLPDNLVSRRHARFEFNNGQWYIVDLNSTNGCAVNDVLTVPNVPMPFGPGDIVDIGTHLFEVLERS